MSISSSNNNNTKQRKTLDYANPCGCGYPSRIWTSSTTSNPGRKFRVCQNSLETKKKSYGFCEWVEEEAKLEDVGESSSFELKISKLENDFSLYKVKTDMESKNFRKDLDEMSRTMMILKVSVLLLISFVLKLVMQ
ncbi:hypothetical protein L1887_10493 [Cichorium endivia]|nr:hypothetical protein L1887_10493 [Cichorium endivia]